MQYTHRSQAAAAGHIYGGIVSLMVLTVIAYLVGLEFIPGGWVVMWIGAAIMIASRVHHERCETTKWDAQEYRRQHLVDQGVPREVAVQQIQLDDA